MIKFLGLFDEVILLRNIFFSILITVVKKFLKFFPELNILYNQN
jgi:hypothetical protein